MDFLNVLIAVLFIILGIYLVRLTEEIINNNQEKKHTSKIGVAGIVSIMIAVVIIIRELNIFLFTK